MTLRLAPFALLAVLAAPLAFAAPAAAQANRAPDQPMRRLLAQQLQRQLDSVAAAGPGVIGIAIEDLTSGERFAVNDSITFPQASAIKVALLLELLRQADSGALSLRERVEVSAAQQARPRHAVRRARSGRTARSRRLAGRAAAALTAPRQRELVAGVRSFACTPL
jgi:beta-lactamase class A